MEVRYVILAVLLIVTVTTDVRTYRIHNLPVALALVCGLIWNLAADGIPGLARSLLAALIPFALLIALFALRMLGAGDIKLLCAIGAIMGIPFILYTIGFSFLAGGLLALGFMLVRGNGWQRLRHIGSYLRTCFLTHNFLPYTNFDDKSDGAKFPFSLAIAAGCAVQILLSALSA